MTFHKKPPVSPPRRNKPKIASATRASPPVKQNRAAPARSLSPTKATTRSKAVVKAQLPPSIKQLKKAKLAEDKQAVKIVKEVAAVAKAVKTNYEILDYINDLKKMKWSSNSLDSIREQAKKMNAILESQNAREKLNKEAYGFQDCRKSRKTKHYYAVACT